MAMPYAALIGLFLIATAIYFKSLTAPEKEYGAKMRQK